MPDYEWGMSERLSRRCYGSGKGMNVGVGGSG